MTTDIKQNKPKWSKSFIMTIICILSCALLYISFNNKYVAAIRYSLTNVVRALTNINWKTYTDSKMGLRFRAPSIDVYLSAEVPPIQYYEQDRIIISDMKLNKYERPEDYYKVAERGQIGGPDIIYKGFFMSITKETDKSRVLSEIDFNKEYKQIGDDKFVYTYLIKIDDHVQTNKVFHIIKDNIAYTMYAMYPDKHSYNELFNSIVSSITFDDPHITKSNDTKAGDSITIKEDGLNKIYTDSQYNYSFTYPQNLTRFYSQLFDGGVKELSLYELKNNKIHSYPIEFQIYDVKRKSKDHWYGFVWNYNEWLSLPIGSIKNLSTDTNYCMEYRKNEPVNINNIKWDLFESIHDEVDDPCGPYNFQHKFRYISKVNDVIYVWSITDTDKPEDKSREKLISLLQSFRFIKK